MSEIKPMNLSGVSHNPLQGGAAGNNNIADKMRANAQLRMAESMNKFKQAQMQRAENDYQIGKRTENFVFSNYPSGKDATWANGTDGMKFGEGTRSKHLARWKEKVGGNLQGFDQYFQAGKTAEMEGIKKSLIRDPLKFSEDGWKKHVSKTIAGWEPDMRESFMNSLDTETRGNLMQYYDPDSQLSWGEYGSRLIDDNFGMDDNPGKTIMAGATGIGAIAGSAYLGYKALRRGNLDKATNIVNKGMGGGGSSSQKLLQGMKQLGDGSRTINGKSISKGKIAQMMESGEITGAQARILGKGGNVRLGPAGVGEAQLTKILGEPISESAIKDVPKYLKAARLDGKLTQSSADQLQGVINSLQKSGKVVNTNNISTALMRLGPKGGALVTQLGKGKINLGPIKGLGFTKGIATAIGLHTGMSYGISNMAEMMGATENNAEAYGDAAGAATAAVGVPAAPHVIAKLKDVYAKKGGSYIIKKLGSKIGMKAAARIVGKGFLASMTGPAAGVVGYGLLAADAYMIYDALSDIE